MKILITSIVDLRKTAHNRLHEFVKHLSRNHNVTVLSVNDYWKANQTNTKLYLRGFEDILHNVNIEYFTQRKISPVFQEVLSIATLGKILERIHYRRFDVHLNYNSLISGYFVARKLESIGVGTIYDIADDLPEMVANSPQIPKCFRFLGKRIAKNILKKNIAISKKVTGISNTLRDSCSIPNGKFEFISNGVDTRLFRKVEGDLKHKLILEDYFVLGYIGVLREWIDFKPVYSAIRNFGNVKLLIVGEEGALKENKELVRKHKVEDKVIFVGTVPYAEVPKYISAMNVCLIPFKQNAISQNSLPLKLFEYMACEKPIISTKLKGVVKTTGNRVLYANSTEDYVTQIKNLISNSDLMEELGGNGRKFVTQNYEWSRITKRLETVLEV